MTEPRLPYTTSDLPSGTPRHVIYVYDDHPWISINPHTCAGSPVFAGTRIHADMPARVLLDGYGVDWVLTNYPTLTLAHIPLSLWFAYRFWPKDDFKRLRRWLRALSPDQLTALGVTRDGQLGLGWDG